MKEDIKYQEIESLKHKVIDGIILIGFILGVVVFILKITAQEVKVIDVSFFADLFLLLSIALIYVFSKKISLQIKSIVIITFLFLAIFMDIAKFGIFSENKILLTLIPLFAILTFNLKKTILINFIGIIGYLVFAYLFITKRIDISSNISSWMTDSGRWMIEILFISIVSFIVLIIEYQFNNAFKKLINNLHEKNIQITHRERSYREIFDSSVDAIFILDMRGNILDVNKSMLKMYGYNDKKELESLDIFDLSSEKKDFNDKSVIKLIKTVADKGEVTFDWQAKKKTGDIFWVEVVLKKTNIDDNDRILAIVRDIDEKKVISIQLEMYKTHLEKLVKERTSDLESANTKLQTSNNELFSQKEELQSALSKLQSAQKQLVMSEKMASIGMLAAGVAHEINNPLNFILGGVYGLESLFEEIETQEEDTEEIKELLNAVKEGVSRATTIVKSLNHFNRKIDNKIENCNMIDIIDNCLVILNNQLKNKVNIEKELIDKALIVKGNDGELHQAILNILKNSEQAIKTKGTIKIKAGIEDNIVKIIITDNGEGISPENINRISEPFFTTKEAGVGTGLGLSITYNIIEEHSGSIEYNSNLNKGTVATIILPLSN